MVSFGLLFLLRCDWIVWVMMRLNACGRGQSCCAVLILKTSIVLFCFIAVECTRKQKESQEMRLIVLKARVLGVSLTSISENILVTRNPRHYIREWLMLLCVNVGECTRAQRGSGERRLMTWHACRVRLMFVVHRLCGRSSPAFPKLLPSLTDILSWSIRWIGCRRLGRACIAFRCCGRSFLFFIHVGRIIVVYLHCGWLL